MSALLALLKAAPSVEVLVIGDAVLDGWLSGPTTRLSREAPVPVVDVRTEEYAAGGAANTAVNLASLGARVRFLSVVGDDEDGVLLRRVLRGAGVGVEDVLVEPGRRTCAKRRISAAGHMVTRYDTGDVGPLAPATLTRLATRLHRRAESADAVVVSDYGLGVLPDAAVGQVASLRHPCVVVDARAPLRWAPARPRAVKPNYDEVAPLLLPGADRAARVAASGPRVLEALGAEFACVTLDTEGAVVLTASDEPVRLHARPQPHDHAAGAGDSFTAALAVGLAAGGRPALAAGLAQAAAQVVVQRRGTTPVTAAELRDALGDDDTPLLDLPRLRDRVAAHRAAGRTIAFTNGCFDVLHAGHVAHLREAATLADVLVVGLNSDESVARLKGPDRPVNGVEDRAAVLAALGDVDHLVVFDGDTPADLLEAVRPDVYVKGGDYTPEMIPEVPLVERLGGRLVVLGYVEDRGTTELLDRIRSPPMTGPDLDVLVPCCGRPASLAAVLAGLTGQSVTGFSLVLSDQSEGEPAYDDPAVRGVLRVLQHRGVRVQTGRHLPRRGIAEHRQHLLEQSSAARVLYLDDDVLLAPTALATLLEALEQTGAGFVGMAMQGLSFLGDERPQEEAAYEEWEGPVEPEVVRKQTPAWERWRLHNAANLVHLERRLGPAPDGGWRAYKVAWLAGCVLFDRAALVEAGGFSFWEQLPPGSAGEDVVAQLRVLERRGGAGVLPSGAFHLELPTTITDRRVDAYAVVIGNPPGD